MVSRRESKLPSLFKLLLLVWPLAVPLGQAATPLQRSTPEAQGVSSAAVSEFVAALDNEISHVHGLMVLRNGYVIAEGWWEPYRPEYIHLLHSLSKSFTSTAIGMAIDEGTLGIDDKVHSFFPDLVPDEPSWNQENMRIRDLLTMSTGQIGEDLQALAFPAGGPIVAPFLNLPVAHKPGTYFLYNTPATYMCSAIVQKVTGEKLIDYLRPRLLDPLGIGEAHWAESSEGITVGGWGLSVNTESIARFAQLYLQEGLWKGRQLVSADWVRAATSRQVSTGSDPNGDWDQGYGFQFWRSRHASYRGDGAFGQFALVLPEHNSVVAINSGTSQMQNILNIVWERLLPALLDEQFEENPSAHRKLIEQLRSLSIPIPASQGESAGREAWLGGSWAFAENPLDLETLSLAADGHETIVSIRNSAGTHAIRSNSKRWVAGESALVLGASSLGAKEGPQRIAASEFWSGADLLSIQLAYTETPQITRIDLEFSAERISVEVTHGGTFRAEKIPEVYGTPDEA